MAKVPFQNSCSLSGPFFSPYIPPTRPKTGRYLWRPRPLKNASGWISDSDSAAAIHMERCSSRKSLTVNRKGSPQLRDTCLMPNAV